MPASDLSVSRRRWRDALRRQRRTQADKARRFAGREELIVRWAEASSARVAARLAALGLGESSRGLVVEVGSGAHGLIWRWPAKRRLALDPLAHFYRRRFACLQRGGPPSVTGRGEELPLVDGAASLVLTDNVLDHVEDPARFLRECRRVLRPGGVLYLTVDVHHPFYGRAGRLYNRLFALGLRAGLPAFSSHPFHFRRAEPPRLVAAAGFRAVSEKIGPDESACGGGPPRIRLRRPYDLLKRFLFKNARLEIVATAPAR